MLLIYLFVTLSSFFIKVGLFTLNTTFPYRLFCTTLIQVMWMARLSTSRIDLHWTALSRITACSGVTLGLLYKNHKNASSILVKGNQISHVRITRGWVRLRHKLQTKQVLFQWHAQCSNAGAYSIHDPTCPRLEHHSKYSKPCLQRVMKCELPAR